MGVSAKFDKHYADIVTPGLGDFEGSCRILQFRRLSQYEQETLLLDGGKAQSSTLFERGKED